MIMTLLKAACLLTYALALAVLAQSLPASWAMLAGLAPKAAAALLLVHALELLLFFKHVRRYPGSLLASAVLTLLFGLMHWRPLAKASAEPHTEARQAAP